MSSEATFTQPQGCEAGMRPRVSPTGDNPPVKGFHTASRSEVEAYAVYSVEAEGSMRAPASAGAPKLAPGPLPGAGFRGTATSMSIEAESGGV